jgi:tetratricopeptide (TPR) repeat protein
MQIVACAASLLRLQYSLNAMSTLRLVGLRARVAVLVASLVCSSMAAEAATWVEARTPNFTVVTDAGEGRARDVAWQFEQVRAAILAGWPWARERLELPVLIVAAKDEASMRLLVPHVFENGSRDSVTISLLCTAPDRYAIVLRSDLRSEDRAGTINPYYGAYWTYSFMSLNAAFEGQLPRWLMNGMAELLSNSIVTRDHIDFGRPTPWTLSTLVNEPRLRLAELISITSENAYLNDIVTRKRFDAQAWGVIHYMLFGSGASQVDRVNEVVRRLTAGETSAQALTQVFGSVEALEQAYLEYHRRPITQFARLKTDGRISRSFPVRTLTTAEAAMIHAGIHTVYGRTADAKALVADARKTEPLVPETYVAEGLLLDAGSNRREAAAAYSKAIELKSQNFFAFYRVAADLVEQRDSAVIPDAKSHAARAVQLNPFHGPSHSLLAQILAQGPTPADGLSPAQRAAALDPTDAGARLALATVLARLSRQNEALGQALAGRSLARTPEQRSAAQELIDRLQPPGAR